MNKKFLHIALLILLLASCRDKETNWYFSLDKNSTEPYGLYLAYDQLENLFRNPQKETIYDLPKYVKKVNESFYFADENNLLISFTSYLHLTNEEVNNLHTYIEKGGSVLMLSQTYSSNFDTVFSVKPIEAEMKYPPSAKDSTTSCEYYWEGETFKLQMDVPFAKSYFNDIGDAKVLLKKKTNSGKLKPVIIEKYIGDGKLIMGLCPELFTNYFLLADSNKILYEQMLSRFRPTTYNINWFSKLRVYPDPESRSGSMWWLLEKKAYRYAFFILLLMAALFFAFETRRKQRIVKIIPEVSNDSMEFIETIGKLYYGEKDNANLAHKMIQYYLEHVRTAYGVPTAHLNHEMAAKLARKVNKTKEEANQFVDYLNHQLTAYDLTEQEIKTLYKTLKKYS